MLTLFPAALVLVDASRLGRHRDRRPGPDGESRLLRFAAERRGVVLTLAGVAAVLAAVTARGVGFDYNLMNLQAPGTESVRWEKRIIESGTRSVFGALDTAGSIAELRAKAAAFRRLPSVAEVDSVTMLIPDDQPAKIDLLSGVRPLVSGLRVEPRRRLHEPDRPRPARLHDGEVPRRSEEGEDVGSRTRQPQTPLEDIVGHDGRAMIGGCPVRVKPAPTPPSR